MTAVLSKIVRTYRNAYSGLPREVWLISSALFINRLGTMVLPFLMLYLTRELGFAEGAAGRLLSLYGCGAIVGTYLGGKLTDRVGAIRLQVFLLLGSVPLFLVIPFCQTWFSVGFSLFCLSVVSEGVRPANSTAVAQLAPADLQTRAFALQRMALNLGFSVGPVIGGLLTMVSFAWLFVVDASTTFLCAVALICFFGVGRSKKTNVKIDDGKKVGSGKREQLELSGKMTKAVSPWRDSKFLLFLSLLLFASVAFFQFQSTYPLYLQDHYGLSNLGIGFVFAANTALIILAEMILVEYVKRWRLLVLIGWGCFFSCFGFGVLPFGETFLFAIFAMMIVTLGEMLSMPLSSGWVAQRSRNAQQGAYMGLYSTTYSIAFLIAPAIGGAIYETNSFHFAGYVWGGPEVVWYLSLLVGLLVLIGFYRLDRFDRRQPAIRSGDVGRLKDA